MLMTAGAIFLRRSVFCKAPTIRIPCSARFIFLTSRSERISLTVKDPPKESRGWVHGFASVVRYTRILFLGGSIFIGGYQLGHLEYAVNPVISQQNSLSNIKDRFEKESDKKKRSIVSSWMQHQRVSRVGNRIVRATKRYTISEWEKAFRKVRKGLPRDASDAQIAEACYENKEAMDRYRAFRHMEGNWQFHVLADTEEPSAFVASSLPRHVFINSSLLSKLSNDDELAMVLGHEVAHLLRQDIFTTIILESALRAFEVVLLGVDPTKGILSLGVMAGLATLRNMIVLSSQRDQERGADALGLELMARACYDTQRGVRVFQKFEEEESQSLKWMPLFLRTHPRSHYRYEDLLRRSQEERPERYCLVVGKRIRSLMQQTTTKKK